MTTRPQTDALPPDDTSPGPASGVRAFEEYSTARLTDAAVRRLCLDLAPLQCLDAERSSGGCVAPDQGGRGTPDPDGRRVAQVDGGRIAVARVAGARLARVPAAARVWLLRVAEVAHVEPSAESLAMHLAAGYGPAAMRCAYVDAAAAERAAEKAADDAHTLAACMTAAHGALDVGALKARAARVLADGQRDQARAAERRAYAALLAWGLGTLAETLAAWEREL